MVGSLGSVLIVYSYVSFQNTPKGQVYKILGSDHFITHKPIVLASPR